MVCAALGAFAQSETNDVDTNSVTDTNVVVATTNASPTSSTTNGVAATNAPPASPTNQYQVNLTLTGDQVATLAAMYKLPVANATNLNAMAAGFVNQAVASQQKVMIVQQRLILANAIRNADTNTLNRLLNALSATNAPSQ